MFQQVDLPATFPQDKQKYFVILSPAGNKISKALINMEILFGMEGGWKLLD